MKLQPSPAALPRGSSPPPSPSRYLLPKALAGVAAFLQVVRAARAPPGAVGGSFGLSERRGSARDGAGAAFARGAFLDDPGPVPGGSAAQVSVRRPLRSSAWLLNST